MARLMLRSTRKLKRQAIIGSQIHGQDANDSNRPAQVAGFDAAFAGMNQGGDCHANLIQDIPHLRPRRRMLDDINILAERKHNPNTAFL